MTINIEKDLKQSPTQEKPGILALHLLPLVLLTHIPNMDWKQERAFKSHSRIFLYI